MEAKDSSPSKSRRGQVTLGNLKVNFANFQVQVEGVPIELTLQEFEALRLMLKEKDRILPYDTLAQVLWSTMEERRSRNLAVLIHRLRRKLGRSSPFAIKTVRGRGYGLIDTRLGHEPEAPERDGPDLDQLPPDYQRTKELTA